MKVYRTRRLVLKRFPAAGWAAQLASSKNWPLVSEIPADEDRGVPAEIMWEVRPGLNFFYAESRFSDDCCVGLIGTESPLGDDDLANLVDGFDPWTLDELLYAVEDARNSPRELPRAVVRAGLGAPVDFDERFFDMISSAADHRDPAVREAAVLAVVYPGWPAFRPLLQARTHDHDERARHSAGHVLAGFDRAGVPPV